MIKPRNCTPVFIIRSVDNRTYSCDCFVGEMHMGNHKGLLSICRYRKRNGDFSTLIATLFRTPGKIIGTGNQFHPEALLATVDAIPAEGVVLPSPTFTQKESPFQPPFFAPAHRLPCSGVLRPVCPFSEGFRSAHSRFASSSRSRMEGFDFSCSSPRRPLFITPSIIL